MTDNLYRILGINRDATKREIKKAYRKLVFKFHPDRNPSSGELFKKINIAYEILSDDQKRAEYDRFSTAEEVQFNYFFNNILNKIKLTTLEDLFVNFRNIFNSTSTNFDWTNYEFVKSWKLPESRVPCKNLQYSEEAVSSEYDPIFISDLDIEGEVCSDLKDIYNKKIKKISVFRKTLDDSDGDDSTEECKQLYVPLVYDRVVINEEGDQSDEGDRGNIIIKVISNNNYGYERHNNNDLILTKRISLHQYVYGFRTSFAHLDEEEIEFEVEHPIHDLIHENNKLFHIIKNKGLALSTENDLRGDLYVRYIITVPENCEDILYKFFPPMEQDQEVVDNVEEDYYN
jgi:DnaJ-class molecular chaperone